MINSKKLNKKGIILSIVVLLIVTVLILFICFNGLSSKTSFSDSGIGKSSSQNSEGSDVLKVDPDQIKIDGSRVTTALPNGRKITYSNTKANNQILLLKYDSYLEQSKNPVVEISHKLYENYLSSVDSNIINDVCGTPDSLKALRENIVYGFLNTDTKEIVYPQNWNCVQALASKENSDTKTRESSKATLNTIKSDIDSFIKDAVVES